MALAGLDLVDNIRIRAKADHHMSYRQPGQSLSNDSLCPDALRIPPPALGDYTGVKRSDAGLLARRSRVSGRSRGEGGASLVEFAFVMPLLLLLVLGIVEFGWLFAQNLDVRHGAREGARLAAVNFPEGPQPNSGVRSNTNRDALVAEICARMQTPTGADVTIASTGTVGDAATVTVTTTGDTLTGFIDFLLPATLSLNSTVQIRLEQHATWTDTAGAQACP
jgi:Flp pilus assembly protein TadG